MVGGGKEVLPLPPFFKMNSTSNCKYPHHSFLPSSHYYYHPTTTSKKDRIIGAVKGSGSTSWRRGFLGSVGRVPSPKRERFLPNERGVKAARSLSTTTPPHNHDDCHRSYFNHHPMMLYRHCSGRKGWLWL